jgi:hypothetical protein
VVLLQVSHLSLFVEAAWLLRATLEYREQHDLFRNNSVENVLLEACDPVDAVMSQLDDILRISFIRGLSYSLTSIIFKGMRCSDSAVSILRSLLRITSRAYPADASIGQRFSPNPEAVAYFIALLPVSTTREILLNNANIDIHLKQFLTAQTPMRVPRTSRLLSLGWRILACHFIHGDDACHRTGKRC